MRNLYRIIIRRFWETAHLSLPEPTFCPEREVSVMLAWGRGRWAVPQNRLFITAGASYVIDNIIAQLSPGKPPTYPSPEPTFCPKEK